MTSPIIELIRAQKGRLHKEVGRQLDKVLLDVFRYWAKRFPKRRLECIAGMGTFIFISEGVDFNILLDSGREKRIGWKPKHDTLLKPLIDFTTLYGCIERELGTNPLMSDFLYNPTTRTIESKGGIIYV